MQTESLHAVVQMYTPNLLNLIGNTIKEIPIKQIYAVQEMQRIQQSINIVFECLQRLHEASKVGRKKNQYKE